MRLNPALGGGDVPVRCEDGVWWMLQAAPVWVDPLPVARLATLLPNWSAYSGTPSQMVALKVGCIRF